MYMPAPGPVRPGQVRGGRARLTNEIGAPDPKLEPQITSLDKCKMN